MKRKTKRKSISVNRRFSILNRDKFTCQYCGSKAPKVELTIDHRIPLCKGGTYSDDNLLTCCEECNQGKNKLILDCDSSHKKYKGQERSKRKFLNKYFIYDGFLTLSNFIEARRQELKPIYIHTGEELRKLNIMEDKLKRRHPSL